MSRTTSVVRRRTMSTCSVSGTGAASAAAARRRPAINVIVSVARLPADNPALRVPGKTIGRAERTCGWWRLIAVTPVCSAAQCSAERPGAEPVTSGGDALGLPGFHTLPRSCRGQTTDGRKSQGETGGDDTLRHRRAAGGAVRLPGRVRLYLLPVHRLQRAQAGARHHGHRGRRGESALDVP